MNPESMTYRFGYFLLTLLTGKQIPLDLVSDSVQSHLLLPSLVFCCVVNTLES